MLDLKEQKHYTQYPKDFEPIEVMKGWLTPEEYRGYLKGNVIKYLGRYRFKNGLQDLKKAQVYAEWLYEFIMNPLQPLPKNPKDVAAIWFNPTEFETGRRTLLAMVYNHHQDIEKGIRDLIYQINAKEQDDE